MQCQRGQARITHELGRSASCFAISTQCRRQRRRKGRFNEGPRWASSTAVSFRFPARRKTCYFCQFTVQDESVHGQCAHDHHHQRGTHGLMEECVERSSRGCTSLVTESTKMLRAGNPASDQIFYGARLANSLLYCNFFTRGGVEGERRGWFLHTKFPRERPGPIAVSHSPCSRWLIAGVHPRACGTHGGGGLRGRANATRICNPCTKRSVRAGDQALPPRRRREVPRRTVKNSGLPVTTGKDAVRNFASGWTVEPLFSFRQGWRRTWVVRAMTPPTEMVVEHEIGYAVIKEYQQKLAPDKGVRMQW